MKTFPLGTRVKCLVTGFVGIAESRGQYLYGCDRYCVQPEVGEDGTVPKSLMIDAPQLEVVGDGVPVMDAIKPGPQLVHLGDEVFDPLYGDKGIATGRAVYLNGCAQVHVTMKRDGKIEPNTWWVDEPQLEVKKRAAAPVATPKQRRTGGPAPSCKR